MISTDYILSYIALYVYSLIECMFFFCQHRYVHYRIMPVIAYQESKAGNSSHHLKRMEEFLQCYVKNLEVLAMPLASFVLGPGLVTAVRPFLCLCNTKQKRC